MQIPYVRLYADDDGESHFEDRLLELEARDFAPPAPPLLLSSLLPGSGLRFFVSEPGRFGDWHPGPQRQWMVRLTGATTIEVSDGERRSLPIGMILLLVHSLTHHAGAARPLQPASSPPARRR
jgi:hypothetical protein